MLCDLKTARKVIGVKQLRKALRDETVAEVFFASDADPRLTAPLMELCKASGVPFETVPTMAELGSACGIDVGSAAAAILR